MRRGDVTNPEVLQDMTYRTRAARRALVSDHGARPPDQGPFSGTYTVDGDEVTFVMLEAEGPALPRRPSAGATSTASCGSSSSRSPTPASRVLYTAHPWRKVG